MAAKAFNLNELETLLRVILATPNRTDRLRAINIFRDANGKDPVEYLVNTHVPNQGAFDAALAGFEGDVSNAVGTGVTADTAELEVLFTKLLVADRTVRMEVLNVVRTELGLPAVTYLVNAVVPNSAQKDAAFNGVTEDAEA